MGHARAMAVLPRTDGAAAPPSPAGQGSGASVYGMELGIPLGGCRVLIADDSVFNRKTLTRFLQWAGITQVAFASTAEEVMERLESFAPDLLLLDTAMPRMDGIAVCRSLRGDPRWRDLPILMQSTLNSDQMRTVCFSAGATDLIAKPINPGECIARVRYHLERRSMVQELRAFRERVERDLRQARAMQLALVPEPAELAALADRHGLTVDSVFRASDEIGGDFWTAFEFDGTRVGVFAADLSGHGIAAAINAFRLHTLLTRTPPEELRDPARLLRQLNLRLGEILPLGQFATAFYGVIDRADDSLLYAAAAAPSPIVASGHRFRRLDAAGLFLGAFRDSAYTNHRVPLRRGDTLFLYSDGLSEALDADGAMLGEDGLLQLARQAAADAPDRPLPALMARHAAAHGERLHDDVTALWITRR
ncbi:PP2C family protein-serine/threonine phosphatase [Azospirillum isscasi]|uniref:Fused response regulator/phosphatase n=1 Tax=Azospirillum isscasi TaxID=3053926 RepID=A0ABU0WI85_9PROT|nr:fused response regulator/phosphatase [Azospirillum isscasi]MDQ2103933.1 fused response regulator/phosphatase [Azospirillum isscasi]